MHKVRVDGLEVSCEVAGSGPPLVLLHGIGSNARSWNAVLPLLSRSFTVVAWDAPGYGQSGDPAPPFTLADYARALRGLLHELGHPKVLLLGHSFGALIAMQFCHLFPECVQALVLADAALGGRAVEDPDQAARKHRERLADFASLSRQEFARRRAPKLLSDTAPPEVVALAVARMSELHEAGYRVAADALFQADAREHLEHLRCPVLILWGGKDAVTPVAWSEWLHQRILGSDVRVFPEAGHLCYLECPDRFAEAVAEFWQRVESGG
ncbi:MAG: alpha/beta hydrolase [Alicyclobacillus sp.]|nr:alpha/beta hydrolase [Alicyclobacillus sp.]